MITAGLVQVCLGRGWSLRAATNARFTRVRPSDLDWPSIASWQKLREAVNGNLIEARSLFDVCKTEEKNAGCVALKENIRNPFFVGDQPAGTQVSGWLDAWTPAPSVYAVKAQSSADVTAAVNFAREKNLRLVVKGGGHSYQGTSNSADSLLIWTRAMNKVALHDRFVGQGCEGKVEATPAVTAEAGAMWIDLYDVVTTQGGRYVQGGGCTSVGVAGLIQSGGFGSFSKGFGTAAAGLLEAEVITADGKTLVANDCTNSDLFWAIKGGGGGSWGVVTKVTLRTHELPEFFGWSEGKIKAKSEEAYRRLIERFIAFYADNLLNPHWGEQILLAPENTLKISMVSQGLDNEEAVRIWQPFFDSIKQSSADLTIESELDAGSRPARHWWDAVYRKAKGSKAMVSDSRAGAPATHAWWSGDQDQVGAFLHGYDSLWLPANLLNSDHRQRLIGALFAASRHKEVELHFNKGLAGAPAEAIAAARQTATNPVVADSFALAIVADGEGARYPGMARPAIDLAAARRNAHEIDQATAQLRKLVPNAGSYVSESNYFNPSWQQAFWGNNYPRLRTIKTKYDPNGLFFVHHGVGSEDWSADGFTRLATHRAS